jgi:hypothetical protein
MFDALIDREDRHVARAAEPPVIEQRLQAGQDARVPVRQAVDAFHVVGAGQVQRLLRNPALMLKQAGRVGAENFFDLRTETLNWHDFLSLSPGS